MLQNATVNKLRCAFVQATYDYFYCQTYSLDCCLDEAKDLYLKYKLTQLPCELTPEIECSLSETKITDYVIECQNYNAPITCAEQLPYEVTVTSKEATLFVHVGNKQNGSAYAQVNLVADTARQFGQLFAILTDSPTFSVVNQAFTVPSGYTIYDEVEFNGTGALHMTSIDFQGLTSTGHPNSYLKTLRLYQLESNGSFQGMYHDIDVDPATSPYLSCVGCTTVNPAHLVFGHSNWPTAFKTLMENAALSIGGDVDLIVANAYRFAGSNKLGVTTGIWHAPTQGYFGLNVSQLGATWYNEFSAKTQSLFVYPTVNAVNGGAWNAQTDILNGPFGDVDVNLSAGGISGPQPQQPGNFYILPYYAPAYSSLPFSWTTSGALSGQFHTITVTVNAAAYSISLQNSDDDLLAATIATTLTYTTATPGVYTITIGGPDGCTRTTEIIIS